MLILLFTASNSVLKSAVASFVALRYFPILSCNVYIFACLLPRSPLSVLFYHLFFSILHRICDFKNPVVRVKQILSPSANISPPKYSLFLFLCMLCSLFYLADSFHRPPLVFLQSDSGLLYFFEQRKVYSVLIFSPKQVR